MPDDYITVTVSTTYYEDEGTILVLSGITDGGQTIRFAADLRPALALLEPVHSLAQAPALLASLPVVGVAGCIVQCLLQQCVGQHSHQGVRAVNKGRALRSRLMEVYA